MKVTIYYSAGYAPAPCGIESADTPFAERLSRSKVGFQKSEKTGFWGLSLRWFNERTGTFHATPDGLNNEETLLADGKCETKKEFEEWLRGNVVRIYVDGRLWWCGFGPELNALREGAKENRARA